MHNKQQLLDNAKELRKNMTPQEKKLWFGYLKMHPFHWRKQAPFGSYVLDFYCAKIKLAIELDGSQHYLDEGIAYDQKRTEFLKNQGIKVIRFINPDIDFHFEAVCRMIDEEIKNLL